MDKKPKSTEEDVMSPNRMKDIKSLFEPKVEPPSQSPLKRAETHKKAADNQIIASELNRVLVLGDRNKPKVKVQSEVLDDNRGTFKSYVTPGFTQGYTTETMKHKTSRQNSERTDSKNEPLQIQCSEEKMFNLSTSNQSYTAVSKIVPSNSGNHDYVNIGFDEESMRRKAEHKDNIVTVTKEDGGSSARGVKNLVARRTQLFEVPVDVLGESNDAYIPKHTNTCTNVEPSKSQPLKSVGANHAAEIKIGASETKAKVCDIKKPSVLKVAKLFESSTTAEIEHQPRKLSPTQPIESTTSTRLGGKDHMANTDQKVDVLKKPKPSVKPRKPPRTFTYEQSTKAKTADVNPNGGNTTLVHKYEDIEIPKFGQDNESNDSNRNSLKNKPGRPPLPSDVQVRNPSMRLRPPSSSSDRSSSSSVDETTQENAGIEKVRQKFRPQNQKSTELKERWTPLRRESDERKAYSFYGSRNSPSKMRRYASDECIYADPTAANEIYVSQNSVYTDPIEIHSTNAKREILHGEFIKKVKLDRQGYAIPSLKGRMALKASLSLESSGRNHPLHFGETISEPRKKFSLSNIFGDTPKVRKVRAKISQAFSIVRRQFRGPGEPHIEEMEEPLDEPHIYDDVTVDDNSNDSESLVDADEQNRRLQYVRTIKEKHYATLEKSRLFQEKIYPQLFDYALVVGLKHNQFTQSYDPVVSKKFPSKVKIDNETTIPQFCFPDIENLSPVLEEKSESFSFVLTGIDGSRQYAYCKRLLPPGRFIRLPEVYCIISPLGAFNLYNQLLDVIEKKRMISADKAMELIMSAYGRPIPKPGKSVFIRMTNEKDEMENLELTRHEDARLEQVNQGVILECLGSELTIKVFSSLLLERKILFTASKLSTLSSCANAMISLLYPFMWQHTFIPVLPSSLLDICCSPTPYIIGILSSCITELRHLPIDEDVMIVDIDNQELLKYIGDETTILPKKLHKALLSAINMIKEDSDMAASKNIVISEAFMRLFVETVGHYGDYINKQQDGQKVFMKEAFCKALPSKSTRMFLEWFTETQMFEVFVTDHLESGNNTDAELELFEKRIMEYQIEMEEMVTSLKGNVKLFGQKFKNLGKQLKKAFISGSSDN